MLLARMGPRVTVHACPGAFAPETGLVMTPDRTDPYHHEQFATDKPAVVRDALAEADFAAVQAKMCTRGPRWLLRRDRQGLERLVRYCARPPLSGRHPGRLGGDLRVYRLRKPTTDGRTELLMTPRQLLDRLAQLVTPPRRHMHPYCGVLAPDAGWEWPHRTDQRTGGRQRRERRPDG